MPRPLAVEILDAIVTSYRKGRNHQDVRPTEVRDFEVSDFERLEIAGPFDVEVQIGAAASVQARGPEWALDAISVEQDGERLFIGCDGECDGDVSMTVTVPQLSALRVSGSGDVSIDRIKRKQRLGRPFDRQARRALDQALGRGLGRHRNRQTSRHRAGGDSDGLGRPNGGRARMLRV